MLSLSLSPSTIRPSVFMEPSAERVRTPEQASCSGPISSPSPVVRLRRKKAYFDSDSTLTTPNSYNPAKRIREDDYSTHDDTSSRESEERSSSFSQTESLWFLPDHQRRGMMRNDDEIISSAPPFPISDDVNNKDNKASSSDMIERETRLPFLPPAPAFSSHGFSPHRRPRTLPRSSNINSVPFFLQPSPKSPLSQSMESMKIHSFLNRPASLKDAHEENKSKRSFFIPKPSSSFHPIRCLDERSTRIGVSSSSSISKSAGLQEAYPLPRRPPLRQDHSNSNTIFKRQEGRHSHFRSNSLNERIMEGSARHSRFRSNSLNERMIIDDDNNLNQQEQSNSNQNRNENKSNVCAFSPFVRSDDNKNKEP